MKNSKELKLKFIVVEDNDEENRAAVSAIKSRFGEDLIVADPYNSESKRSSDEGEYADILNCKGGEDERVLRSRWVIKKNWSPDGLRTIVLMDLDYPGAYGERAGVRADQHGYGDAVAFARSGASAIAIVSSGCNHENIVSFPCFPVYCSCDKSLVEVKEQLIRLQFDLINGVPVLFVNAINHGITKPWKSVLDTLLKKLGIDE